MSEREKLIGKNKKVILIAVVASVIAISVLWFFGRGGEERLVACAMDFLTPGVK
ncbi:MAG: hypothetical protein AB7D02_02865 [Candidatus Paceibacterota bacterium]